MRARMGSTIRNARKATRESTRRTAHDRHCRRTNRSTSGANPWPRRGRPEVLPLPCRRWRIGNGVRPRHCAVPGRYPRTGGVALDRGFRWEYGPRSFVGNWFRCRPACGTSREWSRQPEESPAAGSAGIFNEFSCARADLHVSHPRQAPKAQRTSGPGSRDSNR